MLLVAFLVSVASHPAINLPMLLGKRSDGSFPIWSVILFGPYLYFARFFSFLRRMQSREPPYSEICEGLFVGGWLSSSDKLPTGDPAIIDCTSERPRGTALSQSAYLCVPTWDTRAPQPSEIESAVRWACRKRDLKRPVFIHCAYGHGRSVAVMCALLVALGVAEDRKNAEKIIRERRPYISMNAFHHKSLEEWSRYRLLPKRNIGSAVSSVILSNASVQCFRKLAIQVIRQNATVILRKKGSFGDQILLGLLVKMLCYVLIMFKLPGLRCRGEALVAELNDYVVTKTWHC